MGRVAGRDSGFDPQAAGTALNKDPKQRLQHIGDTRMFLNGIPAVDKPEPVIFSDRGRRRGWFVAAALAVALAAALVPEACISAYSGGASRDAL